MKKLKKTGRIAFIVFLLLIGLMGVRRWDRELEELIEPEVKKEKVYIEYRNLEYMQETKEAVPIMNDEGYLCAVGGTTYSKPVEIPVNDDYEIGVYSFGDRTVFFHMEEEPIRFIVDFKTKEIIGVGIDYQTREEYDREHGTEKNEEAENDSDLE